MKRPKTLQEEAAELRRAWLHLVDVFMRETGLHGLFLRLVNWLAHK